MRAQKHKIIILGHKDLGESDSLLYIYNFDLGKQKIIAKGARKIKSKFTGHLQTLNFCEAVLYSAPRNIILQEIATRKNYFKNINDFNALNTGLSLAKMINNSLFENQVIPELPALLNSTMQQLIQTTKFTFLELAFTIKLLDLLGTVPDLSTSKLNIPEKYQNLLNFLLLNPLSIIEKISAEAEEEHYLKRLTKKLAGF